MLRHIRKKKLKTFTPYIRMESFTNNVIDLSTLPRFETVDFQKLKPNYWKVVLINQAILSLVFAGALGVIYFLVDEFRPHVLYPAIGLIVLIVLILVFSRIAFVKKGFAFREQDVLFRDGIIATNTTIIPYNRVQHVALYEGWLSRYFGLATVEIFTAGGSSSDIKIPGIEKEQAENIKQLLMGKIQQQL